MAFININETLLDAMNSSIRDFKKKTKINALFTCALSNKGTTNTGAQNRGVREAGGSSYNNIAMMTYSMRVISYLMISSLFNKKVAKNLYNMVTDRNLTIRPIQT